MVLVACNLPGNNLRKLHTVEGLLKTSSRSHFTIKDFDTDRERQSSLHCGESTPPLRLNGQCFGPRGMLTSTASLFHFKKMHNFTPSLYLGVTQIAYLTYYIGQTLKCTKERLHCCTDRSQSVHFFGKIRHTTASCLVNYTLRTTASQSMTVFLPEGFSYTVAR